MLVMYIEDEWECGMWGQEWVCEGEKNQRKHTHLQTPRSKSVGISNGVGGGEGGAGGGGGEGGGGDGDGGGIQRTLAIWRDP